jgi:hypothetical protein
MVIIILPAKSGKETGGISGVMIVIGDESRVLDEIVPCSANRFAPA